MDVGAVSIRQDPRKSTMFEYLAHKANLLGMKKAWCASMAAQLYISQETKLEFEWKRALLSYSRCSALWTASGWIHALYKISFIHSFLSFISFIHSVTCGAICNRRDRSLMTLPRWVRKVLLLATSPVLLRLTKLWSDYNTKCYITAWANTYFISSLCSINFIIVMNAHDVFLSKVIINIQCETLFPKHNSRVVCTGIHIY